MKRKLHLFLFLMAFMGITVIHSCTPSGSEDGSLDAVSSFVDGDKYFKASLKALHFVIETSPVEQSRQMMAQLIEQNKIPVEAGGLADGTYTGESPYDAFDYKHVVTLSIKDGKITGLDYNEVHKNGTDKQSDKKYNEEMSITGTTPAVAYPKLEEQLLAKQDMMQVDAVSGATYSLYRFRYAVMLALMKAKLAVAQ